MLRRLAVALLALALAPAALAKDSTCQITYENKSGTDFKGDASLWKGNTLEIGGDSHANAKGGTFPFTLNNNSTLLIQATDSKECDVVVSITNDAVNADLKSEVKATGSNGMANCYEEKLNFGKYGCSCTQSKGAHHADITMTCVGNQ